MAETVVQGLWNRLFKEALGPVYKAAGFKRRAGTFYRAAGDCLHVVNYQKSEYSSRDDVRFTANIGIASRRLLEFYAAPNPPPSTVPEYQCQFRSRIGGLLGKDDVWWDIDASTAFEGLAREQIKLTWDPILKWLDENGSEAALVRLVLAAPRHPQGIPMHEAVLLHRPETYAAFLEREPYYLQIAESHGGMEYILEKLEEEKATWEKSDK
jgi:uncharacterized protein DUF4304